MEYFADGGSNLQEVQNFGNHLLQEVLEGKHNGCDVWTGTDSAVWAAVWNKVMSYVKHLCKFSLNLEIASQAHEVYLDIYHISGDRMITTGLDGWFSGNLDTSVLLEHNIWLFLPLDRVAFEVSSTPAFPLFLLLGDGWPVFVKTTPGYMLVGTRFWYLGPKTYPQAL